MKKMFKSLTFIMMIGVLMSMLTGCSNPDDTVQEFLTAVKGGDFKKATTFVYESNDGYDFNNLNKEQDGIDGKQIFSVIAKNYKFEKPEQVSKKDDTAKVKVKITSVDMAVATTKTIGEIMPMAFASAFSENKEQSQKTMEKMMTTTLVKNLSDKDAAMAIREVTLNLKKDKEGNYKIVSDENLQEALLANSKSIDKMFGNK
ncbi:hypothetical protein [Bacillus sp. UNC437CL72CviS29]|uniref:hypothetical protein n=1 Tax=Bacillus sp. UNC437CL72CviS29 TaxID=1340430 RepID=UPI000478A004|nr:hypothetical protein [Bacillus sp. UNC437CL72CviS29]